MERDTRIKGYSWFEAVKNQSVIVGGAGGIGSYLSFFLSRTSVKTIVLYDFDTIEEHNLAGQLFPNKAIGGYKVDYVRMFCDEYSLGQIMMKKEAFKEDSMAGPYMFSAFDNMAARATMFKRWKNYMKDKERGLFVDGRMLTEGYHLFAVTPEGIDYYEKNELSSDEEVAELPCTRRGTSHVAASLATAMTQVFLNYIDANSFAQVPYKQVNYLDLCKNEVTYYKEITAYQLESDLSK